ncbi:MAG: rRNA maturation RNase YbeY [Chitinophagaceae bacterium]|nr:rRNA maturation RNase YbeY [Chitinophagaceae bacterium]
MQTIHFRNADKTFLFPNKTVIKKFIGLLFKEEKKVLTELTYVFCSDEFLLEINRNYLQHDFYTDIITFDLSETQHEIIGEIYISLDRIKENAEELETSLKEETLRVLFHGALHLCGYKDKTKSQIAIMRKKEEQYLQLYEKSV